MSSLSEFVGRFFCNRAQTVKIEVLALNGNFYTVRCVETNGTFSLNSEWDIATDEIFGAWNQMEPL